MLYDGKKIRTRWVVDVTAEDIEKGKPQVSGGCMAARAVARAIPNATHVEVDWKSVRFSVNDLRYVYISPPAVEAYATYFDAGDEKRRLIEPFKFTLMNPILLPRRRKNKSVAEVDTIEKKQKKQNRRRKTKVVESLGAVEQELSTSRAPKRHKRTGRRTYGSRNLLVNQIKSTNGE